MAPEKSISELSELIQKNTKTLEDGTKGQPGSDFSLAFAVPPTAIKLDASLEAIRKETIEAADELKARLLGPFLYMGSLVLPVPALLVIFGSLYHFGIASHIPTAPGSSITYEDLAAHCGMPLDDLRRVIQTAIAYRIFEEAVPDVSVKHNGISGMIALAPGMKDAISLLAEDNPNGARRFVEAVQRFPGSGEPGHSALMIAERAERGISNDDIADPTKGLFDIIADDEARLTRFRNTMGMATRAPGYAAEYFLDNVPWGDSARCPKTIVDVAGAGGDLSKQILQRYPGVAKATSVDLPEVVETAETPKDLEGRLHFASYNFLTETMAYEADAYLFRHIFHDWSDQYAVKILKNLAPGLKAGTRVWINEVVLPELSTTNRLGDQRQRGADLMMKISFNGKERSKRNWESIFAEADKRFRIESIVQPEGAVDAIIEVVFVNILYPTELGTRANLPDVVVLNQPTTDELTHAALLRAIRAEVAALFGDYGSGAIEGGVKYLSQATSTFILRIARASYRFVWTALSFMNSIPVKNGKQCVFQVVHVSGTIRKAEEEAIRRARSLMFEAKGGQATKASDPLSNIFSTSNRPRRGAPAKGPSEEEEYDSDVEMDGASDS
ncbi:hypothetical protein E0Z10_g10524 [Xylaria hypoxylon]|uniref:O-methyltransferase C-terminal domain-containing protein n=1 Tax=Xylaria hypoxylon TaxID=37992 RepID=A0A4Z0Y3D2_9PEZI|nr:hypothetical protein E0Z10_g10524 [Xylaria hypoxylon]